jgi:dTDP-glucose 4,6-dehydratase/UDP-glucose 4-epimerase
MKILIIGSKGFIGSNLVNYFSKRCEVWEMDIVLDYNNPHFIVFEDTKKHKFDFCINCSGAANVIFSSQNPYNDFNLNAFNVFKFLENIRLYNPDCKFINMSSAAVYGNPTELPIRENARLAPISPYGYHKLYSEQICEEFNRFWGIKTVSLRIFSAYGNGLRKQLFWDLFQKFTKEPFIELWGTGEESRDFIHIDDIAQIVELAMQNSTFNAQVVNVANGEQVKISYVAKIFYELLKIDKPYKFINNAVNGYPINWEADISLIKNWGYKKNTSLEQNLKQYIEWVKENG